MKWLVNSVVALKGSNISRTTLNSDFSILQTARPAVPKFPVKNQLVQPQEWLQ